MPSGYTWSRIINPVAWLSLPAFRTWLMKTWCRAGLPGQSLQNVYTGLARLHIPPRDMVDWINRLPDAGRRLRPLSHIPARAQEALMVAFGAGGILQQTVLDRSTRRHSQATDGPTVRAICLTDLGDAPAWPWPAGCGHVLREDCFVQLLVASGSEAAYRPSCQRDQQGRFRPRPCVPGYWERCLPLATTTDVRPSKGAAFARRACA